MIHKFCINCGVKNSFQSAPPNFCCGCGKPFNKTSVVSQAADEDEDEEFPESIPPKESLAKGWGASEVQSNDQLTFGNLYNNPVKSVGKNKRPAPRGLSEDVLNQSIQECRPVKESKELGS